MATTYSAQSARSVSEPAASAPPAVFVELVFEAFWQSPLLPSVGWLQSGHGIPVAPHGDPQANMGHMFTNVGQPIDAPDFRPATVSADPESSLAAIFTEVGRDYRGPVKRTPRPDIGAGSYGARVSLAAFPIFGPRSGGR